MKTALKALCAATALAGTPAAAGSFSYNDGATVHRALDGNSVIGQLQDGIAYCEYHDRNSAVFGRDFEVYAGNWQVTKNYVCYSYPGHGQDCQRALVQGQRITFMDAGNGAMIAIGTIVSGNVCS